MLRIFDYHITLQWNGKTILSFLTDHGYSHGVIVHLKKTPESILLNGTWEYVNTKLQEGDVLRIVLSEQESSSQIVPVSIPLTICYEDEDLLIVDKPANMPIHPSQGHHEYTLANAVCGYFAGQNIPYTFRCINRLDKDTTGLVLVAKHMLSAAILGQAAAKREISRQYLAAAVGKTPESGCINAPIARKDSSTIERQVDFAKGEYAVTHYQTLAFADKLSLRSKGLDCTDGLSLLSLQLETGRTHQIRVHMNHIGHPLIGDFLYGNSDVNSCANIKRQALHSCRLQFIHPITGEKLDFFAPLPEDMAAFFPEAAKTLS